MQSAFFLKLRLMENFNEDKVSQLPNTKFPKQDFKNRKACLIVYKRVLENVPASHCRYYKVLWVFLKTINQMLSYHSSEVKLLFTYFDNKRTVLYFYDDMHTESSEASPFIILSESCKPSSIFFLLQQELFPATSNIVALQ